MGRDNGTFRLSDLYTAAFVSCSLGIEPLLERKSKKVFFAFPVSDDLYRTLEKYNEGSQIDASFFAQAIRRLKAAMYRAKEEGPQ